MDFSIYPKIPSDYFPKADNSTTIEAWNDRNTQVSVYLTSYQIIVPLVVLFFSIVAISYFLFSNSQAYHDTVKELIDSKTAAGWELRTNMYIVMAISFTFSGYVFCMDIAAAVFREHKTRPEFQWFSGDHGSGSPLDQLYNLTIGLSVVDGVLLGLCSATLIFMGFCRHSQGLLKTTLPWYFLVFPSVNLAAHADQIIIGFIHNSYHATGIGITYGIILVTCIALLRFISLLIHARLTDVGGTGYERENMCSRNEFILVPIFIFLSIIIILSSVYFIALYYLLPISSAIDDAPNRILTIYQSIVVIFAAYFTYWVVVRKHSSPLDFMIKGKDKQQAKMKESQRDKKWKKATYEVKELTLVEYLLNILEKDDTTHATSSSPVTTHATSSSPVTTHATSSSPVTTHATSSSPVTTHATSSSPVTTLASSSSPVTTHSTLSFPVTTHATSSSPVMTHVTSSPVMTHATLSSPVTTHATLSSPVTTDITRAGAQKVYLCKKGHNFQPYILIGPTPTIIKMYCCQVWGVALYQKSLD